MILGVEIVRKFYQTLTALHTRLHMQRVEHQFPMYVVECYALVIS